MKRLLLPVFLRVARLLGINELQGLVRAQSFHLSKIEERISNLELHTDEQLLSITRLSQRKLEHAFEERLEEVQNSIVSAANFRIEEVQDSIVSAANLRIEEVQDAITNTNRQHAEEIVKNELAEIRRSLDNIRKSRIENSQKSSSIMLSNSPEVHNLIDDAMYVNLEDHFRGSSSSVALRQRDYLPKITGVVSHEYPLLDLGCGRGEWLQVLRELAVPAKGVDGNQVCVSECTEAELSVEYGDLIDYLRKSEDKVYGAITMFQVLEHLPFPLVVEVLREARRTLIPGGVFIGEVPNAETLRVGASTFWIDPTHQRPLFPELLRFLAREVGFVSVDSSYANVLEEAPSFEGLPKSVTASLQKMHQQINGPGDFALIATA